MIANFQKSKDENSPKKGYLLFKKSKAVCTSQSRVWVGRGSDDKNTVKRRKKKPTKAKCDRQTDQRTEWVVESRVRD